MGFAGFLKEDVAVTILLGPFVDEANGYSLESGLTISSSDVKITKNSGNMLGKDEGSSCQYEGSGMYKCPLGATDTSDVGILNVNVVESGARPVSQTYLVLPANVYDALFGTDKLEVDCIEWKGDPIQNPNAQGVPFVDLGYVHGNVVNNLQSGRFDSYVGAAANAVVGTADSGSATTLVDSERAESQPNHWHGALLRMTSGANAGLARRVSLFNSGTDTLTVSPGFPNAIAAGDTYELLPWGRVDVDEIEGVDATDAINNQVLDVVNTDTFGLPGQEAPGTSVSLVKMISYLYKAWRNKSTQNASEYKLYNHTTETQVDQKATVSDDGATFTRESMESGGA